MKIIFLFLYFGAQAQNLIKTFPAQFSSYGWIIWDAAGDNLLYYTQGKKNQCSLIDGQCSVGSSPLIPYPHNLAMNSVLSCAVDPTSKKFNKVNFADGTVSTITVQLSAGYNEIAVTEKNFYIYLNNSLRVYGNNWKGTSLPTFITSMNDQSTV
jgi:hypothetical protein